MPLLYAEADLPSFDFTAYGKTMMNFKKIVFDFFENFTVWQNAGMGLYFCSRTPGSGKTLLSCSLGRSVSLRYDITLRFVTAVDYLAMIGNGYHRDSDEKDPAQIYLDCELLILDDIGAEKSGSWQDQELFRLINTRVSKGKVTLFTSNVPQEELNVDAKIVDRIISCAKAIALPEVSIRRKKAKERQDSIISSIIKGK